MTGHARNRFRIVVKARAASGNREYSTAAMLQRQCSLHGMSGEQVAVYAVQTVPDALVVEVASILRATIFISRTWWASVS